MKEFDKWSINQDNPGSTCKDVLITRKVDKNCMLTSLLVSHYSSDSLEEDSTIELLLEKDSQDHRQVQFS